MNQNIYKITMVPQNGIEPLIADYKAAVMPFNYKGVIGGVGFIWVKYWNHY